MFMLHGPLAQQFKVGDRYFALFVPPFSNQPVRVHSWDSVYSNKLISQEGELAGIMGIVVVQDLGLPGARDRQLYLLYSQ